MNDVRMFTDEDLTAYLDEEASKDLVLAIEKALENDQILCARLAALRIPADRIKAAFDGLADQAPAVTALPVKTRTTAPLWWAAAIAGIFVGAWLFTPVKPSDWKAYVAAYQLLYVPETLDFDSPSASEAAKQLAQTGATLGRDLSAVYNATDLDYRRAQILGHQGNALIQIAFSSDTGAPVALCIIKDPSQENSAINTERLEGMSAAYWKQDGFAFLLIGGQDDAYIYEKAEQFRRVM